MIDKTLETLINETIDGTASPEDSARLQAALAADDEARAFFEDLQRLDGLLNAVPVVDPPAEVKKGILRRIDRTAARAPAPAPAAPTMGAGGFSFGNVFARFRPAYGFTFAGGIAAGIAVFALLAPPSAMEDGVLTGVMAPQETYEAFPVADRVSFDRQGVRGTLETRFSSNLVVGMIDVESAGEVEIVAGFDGTLRPIGFRRLEPSSGTVRMGANEIRVRQEGHHIFWLVFEEGPAPPSDIRFRVQSGEQLFEQRL
jgi:anti-sigma factor RsiW